MQTLLLWIGGTDARYWTVGSLAAGALLCAAWNPRRVSPAWFVAALAIGVLAFRWPVAIQNRELGIDESQIVSGALRFVTHPVAWKHVDINTSGPLNAYPVAALGWVGLPVNFLTAHFAGLAMVMVALAGLYGLLREGADERIARLGTLPAAAFFAFSTCPDFVHYTSEHMPLALLGAGSALLWQGAHRGAAGRVFLGTALLGAVPWAKLQGAPLAAWFCLAGGAVALGRWRTDRPLARRLLIAWLAGGLVVSAAFGLKLAVWGLLRQWHFAYIDQAVVYSSMAVVKPSEVLANLPRYIRETGELGAYAYPLALLTLPLAGAAGAAGFRHRALVLTAAGAMAVALVSIALPGRLFYHYLLFGVLPLALLAGALLQSALAAPAESAPAWRRLAVLAGFLAVALVPPVVSRLHRTYPNIPYQAGSERLHRSPAARFLAEQAQPGDTLTVWGWEPRLYIESGLPQATRDGQTERQLLDSPLQPSYRERYLRDLRRYQPRFFVDAVAPSHFAYHLRELSGHETWPELKQLVERNYEFVAEIDEFRIYRRRPGADFRDAGPAGAGR